MSSSRGGGGVEVKDWTEEEGGQWLGLGGGGGRGVRLKEGRGHGAPGY